MRTGIIKKAIEEAEKADFRQKIGAVVFKGSRILGSGYNEIRHCSKINPKYKKYDCSIHAEQKALLSCKDWVKVSGSSILVVRINKRGEFLLSKPCNMCMNMINHLNIKNLYYSTSDGQIVLERL